MSKPQTPPPTLEQQRARTLKARTRALEVKTYHGLERYCLTLYLEPGQVEYLRGLPSLERSSTIQAALKVLGNEQNKVT